MAIAMTLRDYLDERAISYDLLAHRHTSSSAHTAEASHIPGDCLAKGVLLKGDSGYVLAVVPATCRVRLNEVASILDRNFGLADESEIGQLFADCELGALPPLGSAYGLTTVIDERLERPGDIYLEAGDHLNLVHLSQRQFGDLTWDAWHGRIGERM
jgi:Ala-tRNA(Pro) deacylase